MIRLVYNEYITVYQEQVYLLIHLVFAEVTPDGKVKLDITDRDIKRIGNC